jgi:hypothetical protein
MSPLPLPREGIETRTATSMGALSNFKSPLPLPREGIETVLTFFALKTESPLPLPREGIETL